MKQILYTFSLFVLLLVGVVMPYVVSASVSYTPPNVWDISTLSKPLLICTGNTLTNNTDPYRPGPCQDLCDLVSEFINIVYIMIAYAIWVIAPVAFIAGGIMYMLSGANPDLHSAATKTLKGAAIGIVIVLCAYIIIFTFINIFTGLSNYIGGFGASCSIPSST